MKELDFLEKQVIITLAKHSVYTYRHIEFAYRTTNSFDKTIAILKIMPRDLMKALTYYEINKSENQPLNKTDLNLILIDDVRFSPSYSKLLKRLWQKLANTEK